jgi:AcrR family transcriptional regulator
MARIVCEHGVQSATIARVVGAARVSRLTFYDLFADRNECFCAVLEEAMALAGERANAACAGEKRWVDRVRAALLALLELFDQEPELARLCVVHALAAGPETLARRVEVLEQLASFVDQGRGASRSVAEPPHLTAEGVVGGTLGVIHARLVRADRRPLVDLVNPLTGMIALPYLGAAAALREASRPRRTPAARGTRNLVPDPLEGLSIRLTYRTARVIAVVAAQPGLSNREIREPAEITDDGQISKLLARLARLGLVENTAGGHAKSGANAWQLTQRGTELRRAIGRDSLVLEG